MPNKQDDLPEDRASLEALLRKAESRVNLARREGKGDGDAAARMGRVRAKLDGLDVPEPDLSGTKPTMSDSEGNFAANIEVARAGGIGVEASNSTESGAPAKTPEEAVKQDGKIAPGAVIAGRPMAKPDEKKS